MDRDLLIRRRQCLWQISDYLRELTILLGRRVEKGELSSPLLVDGLQAKNRLHMAKYAPKKFTIPFEARKQRPFLAFIQELIEANSSPIHIWTLPADVCGLLQTSSLRDIHFDFPFDLSKNAIVTFSTIDGSDRLSLDFWEDDAGDRWLSVEFSGANWGNVKHPEGMINNGT